MDKKIFVPILGLLFSIMVLPGMVSAAVSVGNEAVSRISLDGASNFVVVDINNPVNEDGSLVKFTYYANQSGKFRFLLVDGNNRVQWVSEEITPVAAGVNTYSPAGKVPVKAGWNLGVYFVNNGIIPYATTGALAKYTNSGDGLPYVGNAITFQGYATRTYSIGAESAPEAAANNVEEISSPAATTVLPPVTTVLANKKLCLGGGWADVAGTSFKDQGECVAFYDAQIQQHIENIMQRLIGLYRQLIDVLKSNR